MGNQFFGISSLNDHVELYFIHWGVSSGCQGWFKQDIMASLASSPRPLVVGIERGKLSDDWAAWFEKFGHSVYVVPPEELGAEQMVPGKSTARAICHTAVLLHSDRAASC